MPYILGLTGSIASGKTTIGLMLLELGAAAYVDADTVVHELYLPGQPLVDTLTQVFGSGIRTPEGGIDRRELGTVVFGDHARLRQLEALVHPAVQEALLARLRNMPAEGIGVLDAVKLVESGYAPLCHGVWVVTCPESVQMSRLVETRGLTESEARQRIAAQPPLTSQLSVATEVIDNSDTMDELRSRVHDAWLRFLDTITGSGAHS